MKKEDLEKLKDNEIIDMVEKSKGHTKTEDFQKLFNCDFSYTYLVKYLSDKRGYERKWVKKENVRGFINDENDKKEILYMEKSEDTIVRKSYLLSKSVADEWKIFTEKIPYNTVVLDYALTRTMTDIRNGNVKIEIRL